LAQTQVFIFAGQSNMSGGAPLGTLLNGGLSFDPSHSSAPYYVPAYNQTAVNEWTGAPPVSTDGGRQYEYPTSAYPCLYNENLVGDPSWTYDAWGTFILQSPQHGLGGALGVPSGFGPEYTFLRRHLDVYPSTPIAAVKCAIGGTNLNNDWLPAGVATNTTGVDKPAFATLRTLMAQAAARLDGAGLDWRWAGFLWWQGESGAHGGQTDDSAYLSDSRAFFAYVRSITRADLPVIVGRIGNNWGWESSPNSFLVRAGYPWAAIDTSITGSGLVAGAQATRDSYRASAVLRRAVQVTLGNDARCAWWDNDDLPTHPPFNPDVAAWAAANGQANPNNDLSAYHCSGPGYMASGERAFTAFRARFGGSTRVQFRGRRMILR
jgi:hypothetical protein